MTRREVRQPRAQIAQLVEQGIENPRVGGSIPSLGTAESGGKQGDREDLAECHGRQEAPGTPPRPSKYDIVNGVEADLAQALAAAGLAGRWDVVSQLARELEGRRLAREPNVIQLPKKDRR